MDPEAAKKSLAIEVSPHVHALYSKLTEVVEIPEPGVSHKMHATALLIACRMLERRAADYMREHGASEEVVNAVTAWGVELGGAIAQLLENTRTEAPGTA